MALINAQRNSIKRGNFNNIDFNLVSDGELVYARDTKKLYIKNDSIANLINNVIFGDTSSKPNPSDIDDGLFYYDTDINVLWLSDGSTWYQLNRRVEIANLRNDVVHLPVKTSKTSRSSTGNYITLNTSGKIFANIAIPSNFSSLVSIKFVFIAASNHEVKFHVNTSGAKAGELHNHQTFNTTLSVNAVNNTIVELDLLPAMTQFLLEPDMYIGINCDPNHKIHALLFKWQYLVI